MRSRALTLSTALGVALLPAVAPPAEAREAERAPKPQWVLKPQRVLQPERVLKLRKAQEPRARTRETAVDAAALLAELKGCTQISEGEYRKDADGAASVPVCDKNGAVFWKADMDIDCDGRATARCNAATDPHFLPQTAFRQSDGRSLSAETLPFVVVPIPSAIWKYSASGIGGGSVVAVVHGDRLEYGVVGDTGPAKVIGEASYAMAKALGIDPDPRGGGVASGVAYIVFKDARISPIESHSAAAARGKELAKAFLRDN